MSIRRTPASLEQADDDRNSLLRQALEPFHTQFDEQTWRAFCRITLDERPPCEVAAELGITEQSVSEADARVRSRIRDELQRRLE
jgi:RNA polymerase sigma-70 factor, ECF subfamily